MSELSRRKFIEAALGTLGAASAEAEAQAPRISNKVEKELFDSKYNKIDFAGDRKELTPDMLAALKDIVAHQNRVLQKSGREGLTANKFTEVQESKFNQAQLETEKQNLWAGLKSRMAIPEYTPEVFDHFMIYELPRTLSQYGIFSKPVTEAAGNLQSDTFESYDTKMVFYKIDRVNSEEIEQWGRTFRRDVLYVDDFTDAGEQLMAKSVSSGSGQTFYHDIIIYNPSLKRRSLPIQDSKTLEFIDRVEPMTLDEMIDAVKQTNDQKNSVAGLAVAKLLARDRQRGFPVIDEEDNTIAHETRHLIDHMDENFINKFLPPQTDKFSEQNKYSANHAVHEEINGILGELRHSKDKGLALSHLAQSFSDASISSDFIHAEAYQWISKNILEIIKKDPQKYGLNLDRRDFPAELQFVLQVPRLADKPELLEAAADEIMKIHEKNLDLDFYEDYKKVFPVENKTGTPWEDVKNYGIPAAVIGAGAYGLYKIVERKNRIAQEERQPQERRKKKASKK